MILLIQEYESTCLYIETNFDNRKFLTLWFGSLTPWVNNLDVRGGNHRLMVKFNEQDCE
jgi:hypothetical protein